MKCVVNLVKPLYQSIEMAGSIGGEQSAEARRG
jgi:hypothetical protein